MSFSEPMNFRQDLGLEFYETLDESGEFTSGWVETSGTFTIRVACTFEGGSPVPQIEEGQYDEETETPRVMRVQAFTVASNSGHAQIDISARYFRFAVTGGAPSSPVAVTVRTVA